MANKPKKVLVAYVGTKADLRRKPQTLDDSNSVRLSPDGRKAYIPMLDSVE